MPSKNSLFPRMVRFSRERRGLSNYYGIFNESKTDLKDEEPRNNKTKKDTTREAIDRINKNREHRRIKMEEKRKIKLQKEVDNQEQGIKCDVDFQLMVENEKAKVISPQPHVIPDLSKINIWVRKRPIFEKEALGGEIDWISWTNPAILLKIETKDKIKPYKSLINKMDGRFAVVMEFYILPKLELHWTQFQFQGLVFIALHEQLFTSAN